MMRKLMLEIDRENCELFTQYTPNFMRTMSRVWNRFGIS